MANANRPSGFRVRGHESGAPFSGQTGLYFIPATDPTPVGIGDFVKLAASADPVFGYATVTKTTSNTDQIVGVVVGFRIVPNQLDTNQSRLRAANVARYAIVAEETNLIGEMQANGPVALTDIGLNAGVTYVSPSLVTGQSQMQVDMSTKGTTNTLPVQILAFSTQVDNDFTSTGLGANVKLIVRLNDSQYGPGVAGI